MNTVVVGFRTARAQAMRSTSVVQGYVWHKTHQQSTSGPRYGTPLTTSGDAYSGLPQYVVSLFFPSNTFDKPKSAIWSPDRVRTHPREHKQSEQMKNNKAWTELFQESTHELVWWMWGRGSGSLIWKPLNNFKWRGSLWKKSLGQ